MTTTTYPAEICTPRHLCRFTRFCSGWRCTGARTSDPTIGLSGAGDTKDQAYTVYLRLARADYLELLARIARADTIGGAA